MRARAFWYVLASLGAAGLVILLAFLLARQNDTIQAVRDTQLEGSPSVKAALAAAEEAKRGTDIILDCTQPEGKCYKNSQRQTIQTIASINEISVYAAACADRQGEQTVIEIQNCVIARLAAADRGN